MRHNTFPSIHITIYVRIKEHVVQDKEQQRPLDKRHVKSLDFIHSIFSAVAQIFFLEAVSADKEEQRHMEHIDESRSLMEDGAQSGMAYHHQYNGDSLGYGYSIFAHGDKLYYFYSFELEPFLS